MPVWLLVLVATEPGGGWLVLAGVPTWLAVGWRLLRTRGVQTGALAVDCDGVIHVLSGRRAIRRLQRLFEVGVDRWMRHSVAGGLLLCLILFGGLGVAAVILEDPCPLGIVLAAGMLACLDLGRFVFVSLLLPRLRRMRPLRGNVILPALALYARQHGLEAATGGVSVDLLAASLVAHPDALQTVLSYARQSGALSKIAQQGGAASLS